MPAKIKPSKTFEFKENYKGSDIVISVESNTGSGVHTVIFAIDEVEQWKDDTANNQNIRSKLAIGLKALRDSIDNIEDPELVAMLDAFGFKATP